MTAPRTAEGMQAWEVMLKLSGPDLTQALKLAENLGFDAGIMAELLPAAVQVMKAALNENKE